MEENKDTAVAVNNLLDVRGKFDSKELIANIKESIKSGNVKALEGWTILKRMEKVSKDVMEDEDIKKMAFAELEKYSGELKGAEKSVKIYSASISISPVHTFYDFKDCGHEVLDQLYKIKEHVDQMIKQTEEEVKTIPPPSEKVELEFGIKQDGRETAFPKMPKLTWEDYGVVGMVKAPRKIQKIGMRFNKV